METMLRSIKCDCHCDQESNMVMVMVWEELRGGGNPPHYGTLGWGGIPSPGDEIPPT